MADPYRQVLYRYLHDQPDLEHVLSYDHFSKLVPDSRDLYDGIRAQFNKRFDQVEQDIVQVDTYQPVFTSGDQIETFNLFLDKLEALLGDYEAKLAVLEGAIQSEMKEVEKLVEALPGKVRVDVGELEKKVEDKLV